MLTADGWFDWCERVPGPADKVYSEANAAGLYIPHSAVGYYGGWSGRLFSTARTADGRYTDYAAASVHLWLPRNRTERPKQHYSIFRSCWASGSRYPNTHGVAAENEGGYDPRDEPLTGWQVECNARAIREVADFRGWVPRRPTGEADLGATLYEHRECVRWGSAPTACPSDRIPWQRLLRGQEREEEDDMQTMIHAPGGVAVVLGGWRLTVRDIAHHDALHAAGYTDVIVTDAQFFAIPDFWAGHPASPSSRTDVSATAAAVRALLRADPLK